MAAANVMASPVTAAVATRWIEDGTADAILAFIRTETRARQRLAAEILAAGSFRADPLSFNIWMALPEGWTRSAFAGQMRGTGAGIVASDIFVTDGSVPPETVRLCLGGTIVREDLMKVLHFTAHRWSTRRNGRRVSGRVHSVHRCRNGGMRPAPTGRWHRKCNAPGKRKQFAREDDDAGLF